MANFVLSTNMQLPVPVVGVDPGPDWSNNLNASLALIDSHDHSSGRGVPITPAGISITTDLPFSGNNAVGLRSARYQSQGSVLAGATDLACTYVVAKDLYFNDGSGNQVRITQNGGIAGSPGSISNLVSPASASYNSGTGTFIFQSAANTPAGLDAASVVIRNPTSGSNGVTISPPASLSSNYTLTVPTIPTAQSFMTIDSSGNMSGSVPLAQGITQSMIANGAVGPAQKAAVNYAISSYQSATTGWSSINNGVTVVTVTLTTNGRPVVAKVLSGTASVQGFTGNGYGYFELLSSSGSSSSGASCKINYTETLQTTVGGTGTYQNPNDVSLNAATATTIVTSKTIYGPIPLSLFDPVPAGTYTYGFFMSASSLYAGTVAVDGLQIVAYEL